MGADGTTLRIALLGALAVLLAGGVFYVDSIRRGSTPAGPQASVAMAAPAFAPAGTGAPAAPGLVPRSVDSGDGVLASQPGDPDPIVTPAVRRAGGVVCSEPHVLARVDRDRPVLARPGGGAELGTLPARSAYLGQPMTAWIRERSADGAWGRVTVPWYGSSRAGWVRLDGMTTSTTRTMVLADLSDRTVSVLRGCRTMFSVPAAVGTPSSASPTGRFFVTDRVAVPSGQPQFGSYAFGISAVQPNLPAGWTGGDQMAIHGTNDPGSIGSAASAGCLRVSERALDRLRPLLVPGTPVVIVP